MQKAILIILVFFAAVFTVTALARFSKKPNDTKNGFLRNFVVERIMLDKNETFSEDLTDICGVTNTRIYFSTKMPGKILATTHDLEKKGVVTISIAPDRVSKKNPIFYQVASSDIHVYEGNIPAITSYDMTGRKKSTVRLEKGAFSRIIAINSNTFVMRKINKKIRDQRFVKYDIASNELTREKGISVPSKDVGLSSDGKLCYDDASNLLCYVQFYTNEFATFDTNMNFIGRYKTIDTSNISTFSSTLIGVANGSGNTSVTNDKPVRIVNKTACVNNGIVYVYSKLKADNESTEFEKNAVIDMYNLKTGQYAGSFYIPLQKGKPPYRFNVYKDRIFVMYGHNVVVYRIKF